jgi:hypothetical protein
LLLLSPSIGPSVRQPYAHLCKINWLLPITALFVLPPSRYPFDFGIGQNSVSTIHFIGFTKGDRVFNERFVQERVLKNGICSSLVTIQIAFDQAFDQSPLKIINAANYVKCVPRQDEQLLYWSILKCLIENWRTRQKFWDGSKRIGV